MGKKITITDIAKETGLSPSTISRALNHKHLVNPDTLRQITAAMEKLGYKLPQAAPQAEEIQKRILVVNVSDISNSFYAKIYQGIVASATNHGWYVMITQEHINSLTLSHFLKLLKNCNAIGLILCDLLEREVLDALSEVLPVVQCCEFDPVSRIPYVGIDNYTATLTLMEYLISHNHQRIALVNGPQHLVGEQERQRGYETALTNARIPLEPQLMLRLPSSDYFMAHTGVLQLLNSGNIPDAIFAVSDLLAFASINAIQEFGLSVPGDISVIGFDNISLSEMSTPKISTVNHPCFEIGFLCGEMIHQQCSNHQTRPQSALLNTELILRDSTR